MSARQPESLSDSDLLILGLLAMLWTSLFGVFFYFVPSFIILLIGLLCTVVSTAGYILVGGLKGLSPKFDKEAMYGDELGWRQISSHDKRSDRRAA